MQDHATARRARRSLLKAAAITIGSVAAISAGGRQAGATGGHGGGGGHGHCFLRGTMIRAIDGFRTIESLSAGDLLPSRFGTMSAVRKVGSFIMRRSDLDGSWPGASRPVLVKRGAFADGSPRADLRLTASHAVFLDGVLIPVGNLVNGTTIVLDATERSALEFFHVELDGHDVIDAEGAACESYRPDGMQPCAPLLTFNGGRDELRSRLRSAASVVIDRRQPIDVIRDNLEERGLLLHRAARAPQAPANPG